MLQIDGALRYLFKFLTADIRPSKLGDESGARQSFFGEFATDRLKSRDHQSMTEDESRIYIAMCLALQITVSCFQSVLLLRRETSENSFRLSLRERERVSGQTVELSMPVTRCDGDAFIRLEFGETRLARCPGMQTESTTTDD